MHEAVLVQMSQRLSQPEAEFDHARDGKARVRAEVGAEGSRRVRRVISNQ